MEYVTKIVHEYNDIVAKLTPAEVCRRKPNEKKTKKKTQERENELWATRDLCEKLLVCLRYYFLEK